MRRHWWILFAVTLGFFFLNAATFTSLGVVLYSMIADLHWSQTAAGFSFTLLGVACGLSSPIPAVLMRRVGVRWTVMLGAATLTAGFILAAVAQSIWGFYVAMLLLGTGYSLAGNVPGVYIVSSWFPRNSSRMIGVYMMGGAFGAVVGPLMVQSIVELSGNWRYHWYAMAAAATVIGAVSLVCIRDARSPAKTARREESMRARGSGWSYRDAIVTPQFLMVAGTMTMTMACVTTIHSVTVSHLTMLGARETFGAIALSIIALVSMLAKGAAGPLCERIASPVVLSAGLCLQAVGITIFGFADSPLRIYSSALIFGLGWGFAYVAASVVLLGYFGREMGAQLLGAVWLVATLAAIGPVAAGAIADAINSFSPILYLFAVMLLVLAVPVAFMQKPQPVMRTAVA